MSIAEKLTTIAENEQRVYDSGYKSFWKAYQSNGNQIYGAQYMFSGVRWNDYTFYPMYDIVLYGNSSYVFAYNNVSNLRERMNQQGVTIRLNSVTTMSNFFWNAKTKEIPTINLNGVKYVDRFCQNCTNLTTIPAMDFSTCQEFSYFVSGCSALKTIELINFSSATSLSNAFTGCSALEDITVDGVNKLSINFSACSKLTIESLRSIISALYDFVGNGETTTRTLTLHATAKARLTEADIKTITDKGWTLV